MSDSNTQQPAESQGTFIELDPKKLGLDGREMFGELKALTRWCAMFGSMRDRSTDINERVFLKEVVTALEEDAERVKMVLTEFALKRGAAKEHKTETDAKAN